MPDSLPRLLRRTTRQMTRILEIPKLADHPNTPSAIETLGPLLAKVETHLKDPARRSDADVATLLPEYSKTLLSLEARLNQLQSDLGERRAELSAERKRLSAARSWTATYMTTVSPAAR